MSGLFKGHSPLMFECPLCGKIFKQGEWLKVTITERCEMDKRGCEFSNEIECEEWDCVSGEVYMGHA